MFDFPTNIEDGYALVHPNGKTYVYEDGSWVISHGHEHDDLVAALVARIDALETQLAQPYLLFE